MADSISNCDEVKAAVAAQESSPEHKGDEERYIIKRAMELGCTEHIPDSWELQ